MKNPNKKKSLPGSANLADNDRQGIDEFLDSLNDKLNLTPQDNKLIRADVESALLMLIDKGVPAEEAIKRVDSIGDFYRTDPDYWFPLDNGAKIYPLSMKRGWMATFRMSMYMTENVEPQLLQMALNIVIGRFPTFATTLKRGVFWHYLDGSKHRYTISRELEPPGQPLNVSRYGAQSFKVVYFENRISLECFHVLCDGVGGMAFLQTLVAHYIRLKYGVETKPAGQVLDVNSLPEPSELENVFLRGGKADKATGFGGRGAVQINGALSKARPCRVLHFELDGSQLKTAAKARGTSVTGLMLTLAFLASKDASNSEGTLSIQVPVNMRSFYGSNTLRNFSMFSVIRIPKNQCSDFDTLLPIVKAKLEEGIKQDSLEQMMALTNKLVKSLRPIPLFIKRPVARAIYGILGDRLFTTVISNLGVVKLPETMTAYVEKIDAVIGTPMTNRATCSMITYNNRVVLAITKITEDESFERAMLTQLLAQGIEVDVYGSEVYGR